MNATASLKPILHTSQLLEENELLRNVVDLERLTLGQHPKNSDMIIISNFRYMTIVVGLVDLFVPPMWEMAQSILNSPRRQGLLILMGAVYSNYRAARQYGGEDGRAKGRAAVRLKPMVKKVAAFIKKYGKAKRT